jgi:hypothetical protein
VPGSDIPARARWGTYTLHVLELAFRYRLCAVMTATHGERWFKVYGPLQAPHQRAQVSQKLNMMQVLYIAFMK